MTNAVDLLFKAVTEPEQGPPRATVIYNAQIYVDITARIRDVAFRNCTIQCAFVVNGPGNASKAIVKFVKMEEMFSPQFQAAFQDCTFEQCNIDGVDTQRLQTHSAEQGK